MALSVFLLPPCRGMLSTLRFADLVWTGDAMPQAVFDYRGSWNCTAELCSSENLLVMCDGEIDMVWQQAHRDSHATYVHLTTSGSRLRAAQARPRLHKYSFSGRHD